MSWRGVLRTMSRRRELARATALVLGLAAGGGLLVARSFLPSTGSAAAGPSADLVVDYGDGRVSVWFKAPAGSQSVLIGAAPDTSRLGSTAASDAPVRHQLTAESVSARSTLPGYRAR